MGWSNAIFLRLILQSDLAMAEATAPAANYTASRLVRDLHAVPRYDWHVSTRVAHVSPSGETVGDVGSSSSPVHARRKTGKTTHGGSLVEVGVGWLCPR